MEPNKECLKGFADHVTYVLLLEEGRIYVGLTTQLNHRLNSHFRGTGAKWTQLYSPEKLIDLYSGDREDEITDNYIAHYGWQFVRGGYYCQCQQLAPKAVRSLAKRAVKRDRTKIYEEACELFGVTPTEPKVHRRKKHKKQKRRCK
tara:strand:+ start:70 stop:507 length:438 start_codon:yes stop_codon:yes gene_type:complete